MACRKPFVVVFSHVPNLAEMVTKRCPGINLKNVRVPPKGDSLGEHDVQTLHEAEVLLACPHPLVTHDLIYTLPKVQWVQSTWAGNDSLIRSLHPSKPLPSYIFTKTSGKFGPLIAEYVLGHMISRERKFPEMKEEQNRSHWNPGFRSYRPLSELTLGILGLGDIGKTIARYAKTFGMKVQAYVRTEPKAENMCPHVDEFMTKSGLGRLLSTSHYLCSVLPSTPQTVGLLSGDVLSQCKNNPPVLINVGRGDVINEESLLKALDQNWLDHAVLDVFEKEPLPESSRLWSHPRVTISPHVSGVSLDHHTAEAFAENYELFKNNQLVKHQVDWEAGY